MFLIRRMQCFNQTLWTNSGFSRLHWMVLLTNCSFSLQWNVLRPSKAFYLCIVKILNFYIILSCTHLPLLFSNFTRSLCAKLYLWTEIPWASKVGNFWRYRGEEYRSVVICLSVQKTQTKHRTSHLMETTALWKIEHLHTLMYQKGETLNLKTFFSPSTKTRAP